MASRKKIEINIISGYVRLILASVVNFREVVNKLGLYLHLLILGRLIYAATIDQIIRKRYSAVQHYTLSHKKDSEEKLVVCDLSKINKW
jgi:hypothetical protein